MTDEQKKQIDLVGQYLAACRPPVDATNGDVLAATKEWNELVQPIIASDQVEIAKP